MNPDRWQKVDRLFQATLALAPEGRGAFLDDACRDEPALRHEVESLLAADKKMGSFMNVPVQQVAAQLIAADGSTSQIRKEDDLSASPTLPQHETKSGSTTRRRIILVGLFLILMSVNIGVNSYHAILYFSTAGDPGWLLGFDGRVRTYGGVSGADVSALRDGDEVMLLHGRKLRKIRQYYDTFACLTPGATYTMVVRRDGRPEQLTLRTASYHLSIRIFVILLQLVYFLTNWISHFSLKAG